MASGLIRVLRFKQIIMLKIKRPLAVIGFTFFITGTTVLSMPKEYTAILLALFALFVFVHSKTRKVYTKHLLLMLITAVISSVYVNTYTYFYQKNINSISNDTQSFTAYVKEINNIENTSYTLTVLDENYREIYNVSVYYSAWMNTGDVVEVTGKFKPAKSDKYIFSNYSKDIIGSISAQEITLSEAKVNTVKYKALTIKNAIIKSAAELYSNEYLAVVSAIALNDKHLLNSQIKGLFRTAGMSHALVVSGLHVGIIVIAVQSLLKVIPIHKKIKNIVTAVVTFMYMYVVGMSAAVTRAGFLALVILLTRNINKEQDSFTTLSLIGFISIVINPYVTRDIGALLSYSACIGIIIANQWCTTRKIKSDIRNFICTSAAVLFTMPVLAIAQMNVTLMSPVYNVCFALFITIICVLSVFTPVLNMIPVLRVISPFLAMANKMLISSLLNILMFINKYLNFTTIRLNSQFWIVISLSVLIALFIAHFQFSLNKYKKIFVIAVSILVFICYNLLNCNILTITAFDSGRESSFHILVKGREYMILSEDITASEAESRLVSSFGNKYRAIYYCPKDFKTDIDMSMVADKTFEVNGTDIYKEDYFTLTSEITGNKKLFKISVADCDISFGHGKVTSTDNEYYFLGNDKPKNISAQEIYIFGNTPDWMKIDNINNIDSDIKIRINLKTGKYKTVKDVFNFGYRI